MRKQNGKSVIPVWILAATMVLAFSFSLSCGGDSDSGGRLGRDAEGDLGGIGGVDDDDGGGDDDSGGDDDIFGDDDAGDDDADDDHWDDDADDDADDDVDDDDELYIASIVLTFFPDPEDYPDPFYPGQSFDMELILLDQFGNDLGVSTDYDLDISPNAWGVEYDTQAGVITFNRDADFTIAAEMELVRLRSNEIQVSISYLARAEIVFTNPPRGLFTQAATVGVSGECFVEGTPCHSVLVNGLPTLYDAEKGEFSITLNLQYGMNIIVAEAFNAQNASLGAEHITVLMGDYLANGAEAFQALMIRVTHHGFRTIGEIAEDLIQDMDLLDFIGEADQEIFDLGCIPFLDLCTWLNLAVESLSIGTPQIILNTVGGNLVVDVTIPDVHTDLKFYGEVLGINWQDSGSIDVTIQLQADVNFTVTPEGILQVHIDGMSTTIYDLDLDDFLGIIGEIFGFIEDLTGSLNRAVNLIFSLFGEDLIKPLLEEVIADQLRDLDMSTDFEFSGKTYYLAAKFQEISADYFGLLVKMRANMSADYFDPTVPAMPGNWKVPGLPPSMEFITVPGTLNPYAIGVAVNDDILNQALYEIFRSGAMKFEFADDSLDTQILGLFFPALLDIHPNAPVILRLEPLLQPILTLSATDGLNGRVQIGEYLLHMIVDHPVDGEVLAFTAAMALVLPTAIDVDGAGRLTLDFDRDNFQMEISIFETDYDFRDSFVEGFIPLLVQMILPLLGNLLGAIEIPSFEGYVLDIDALTVLGESGDFMGIFGNVTPEP